MTRVMGAAFALGAACFFVGPLPGYLALVGPTADAITFFAGSLLFTCGGALQAWLAAPHRYATAPRRAAWRAAIIQSAGTLSFNVTTFRALSTATSSSAYDKLVWRPDAVGSLCFLVSAAIAFRAAPRDWRSAVNLAGCVLFGISAVAGHVVPASGSVLDLAAANWTTCLGAACFFVIGVAALRAGDPSPRSDDAPALRTCERRREPHTRR